MLSWQNILSSRYIAANIEEKLVNQEEFFRTRGGISRIHLSLSSKWKSCHGVINSLCYVISERHWKSTFDFTEIVNNYGLKLGTVCKILRFISQFSLKLYIQLLKYFHSMVLGSLGRGCCGKNRVLKFLANVSNTSAPLTTFLAFKSCKAIDTLKVISKTCLFNHLSSGFLEQFSFNIALAFITN